MGKDVSTPAQAPPKTTDERKSKPLNVRVFPDAAGLFSTYPGIEEVVGDCMVVLDTNALLVPYETSPESLDQIRRTFLKLASEKRLMIPGQVAREFVKNRPKKLANLHDAVRRKMDTNISTKASSLLSSMQSHQTMVDLEGRLSALLKEYRKSIRDLLAEIASWTWSDPVSAMYGEAFSSSVLDPTFDEDTLKDRQAECVMHKLPPGYKDASKDENGDGDLRIWETILRAAANTSKSTVFVSGDDKADWWHRVNKTPLYPRIELVDEYRRTSGGGSFHILSFSDFLKHFGATSEVVEEVASSEKHILEFDLSEIGRLAQRSGFAAEKAVGVWLSEQFPSDSYAPSDHDGKFDFIVDDAGESTGVIVKVIRHPAHLRRVLRRISSSASPDEGRDILVAAVVFTESGFQALLASEKRTRAFTPSNVRVIPMQVVGDRVIQVGEAISSSQL